MQTGLKIAVCGKGGVGKTTICAVLAQLFAEGGFEVLAIDADPNTNLASAFGLPQAQSLKSLIDMKQLIAERTGTGKDAVGAYFRLNPKVSDLPEQYWLEIKERLKLLVLGGITQAGAGCACPEGAFLKAMLNYTILQRQELVLVDLAAGVEFMGRASIQGTDALIVVVEPGSRSIETAVNIVKMGKEMGIKHACAVLNKITDQQQCKAIETQLKDINIVGCIKYDKAIQEADLSRTNVFLVGSDLVGELRQAKKKLTVFIMSGLGSDVVSG